MATDADSDAIGRTSSTFVSILASSRGTERTFLLFALVCWFQDIGKRKRIATRFKFLGATQPRNLGMVSHWIS